MTLNNEIMTHTKELCLTPFCNSTAGIISCGLLYALHARNSDTVRQYKSPSCFLQAIRVSRLILCVIRVCRPLPDYGDIARDMNPFPTAM